LRYYTADRLLPGGHGEVVADGGVLVDGGSIAWAGADADLPADLRAGAEVVPLGDATLLPGLVEGHVHLGFDGGPTPVARMKAETDAEQLVLMLRSARELLSVGVTTARDLGSRAYLDVVVRDAVRAGMARGPRLVTAGAPLTVTGGHCWFMGGECDTEDDVRRTVRRHHKAGVDLIKVMSTGGFMTAGSAPWFAQFTEGQLRAAVEEAHRLGKRVAAHAHGTEGIRRAVAAGVDTIEHCSFVGEGNVRSVDLDLADRIAEQGISVCTTTNHRLPAMVAARGPGFRPAIGTLHERGVKIIAGADAGIDNVPHHAFVGGLEAMALQGLTPADVLFAATVRGAEALGLGDVTGRLRAGYAADLIAVAGDPLRRLDALRDLRLVVAAGEEFTPDPVPPTGSRGAADPSLWAALETPPEDEGERELAEELAAGAGPEPAR
jgi:imidazolonepropionase-like amidohydrolase